MPTNYQITLTLDQDSADELQQEGYSLYAFKAVQTSAKGSPVVWFATTDYGLTATISWQEQYQGYTSKSDPVPDGQISVSNAYNMDLNQTLNITSPTGTGQVDTTTGTPRAVTIYNQTTTAFTCGLSQQQGNGTYSPLCAFPLHGGSEDLIAPIEKVLLMFATQQVNTGTVIEKAFGPGVLIDLTEAASRAVAYNIDAGWNAGGASWAQKVPPNANLVPILIQSS